MSDTDGFLDVSKIPDGKGRVIVQEVFGLARPLYDLRKICRVIPSPKQIQGNIQVGTNVAGSRKVPAMVRAKVDTNKYVAVEFTCWKNVAHVAVPDEAEFGSVSNALATNVGDAAADIGRMEDLDVGDALTATIAGTHTVAGSAWNVSANEPSVDIGAAAGKINENSAGKYEPDSIAMRYSQYVKLASNPEAKKFIQNSTGFGEKAVVDRYFGLNLIINHAIPDGEAWVLSTKAPALVLIDGPERARTWEDGAAFFTGYATAKYDYVKRIIDDAVCSITSI